MKKGYDLIIIGNSEKSFFTAEYAASFGARVGLIKPHQDYQASFLHTYKSSYLNSDFLMSYGNFIDEQKRILWHNKNYKLKKIGIDIINYEFQFISDKNLRIRTAKDNLVAPNYLLSLDQTELFDDYNHTYDYDYMTIAQLIIEDKWNILPNKIAILGNNITAIYLAQQLQKLDKDISLFTVNNCLLAHEDQDISWQLQLHLEAKGIKFYFDYNLNEYQLSSINNLYDKLIITDVNNNHINDSLGLAKLGVKIDRHGIKVNSKLQTDNPQIYGCGDILGGYHLDNIAEYEAKIAVKNALFVPWHKVNYSEIPYCLNTNPPIYRVGYTEKQARLLFGNGIKVISLSPSPRSSLLNSHHNIYYLKIILDRQNSIIGFHSLGLAEEIFTAMTLMLKNNQPFNYLFKLNFIQASSYQLIKDIQKIWQEKNKNINNIIMSLTETFFICKKDYI